MFEQVVDDLDMGPALGDGDDSLLDLAFVDRRPQRRAKGTDFTLVTQLVKRGEQVIITQGIDSWIVQLVEIDVISLQPFEAPFAGQANERRRPVMRPLALARLHARVIVKIVAELGGDHDLIAPTGKRLRQQGLAFAVSVDIGRVKKVHPSVQRPA